MDMEETAMKLIVNSGDAKSKAMDAIENAKAGKIPEAEKALKEADEFLTKAHKFQTNIIQEEADGNIKSVTILMAHAQDHMMNAITVIDMAREFVDLYAFINNKK